MDFGPPGQSAAGAEDALNKLIQQRLDQARLNEQVRSHQANEALLGRRIDVEDAYRKMQQADLEKQRHEATAEKAYPSLMPGSDISGEQFAQTYKGTSQEPGFSPSTLIGNVPSQFAQPPDQPPVEGETSAPTLTGRMRVLGTPAYQEQQRTESALTNFQVPPNEPALQTFARLRAILPKGENIPADIITGGKVSQTPVPLEGGGWAFEKRDPTTGQIRMVDASGKDITGTGRPFRQPQTIAVQTVDAEGNRVTKIVPKTAGATYEGPLPQQIQNRMYTAKGVINHFDERGGQQLISDYSKMLDSGKMSKDALIGSLNGLQKWMSSYAKDPRHLGAPTAAPGGGGSGAYQRYLDSLPKQGQ